MSAMAADLRAEADEMERDANDVQYDETVSRDVYKGYKANMHALRAYAQQLEDAAKEREPVVPLHSADSASREMRRQRPRGKQCGPMRP